MPAESGISRHRLLQAWSRMSHAGIEPKIGAVVVPIRVV
jgi:hypothetical protein